MIVHDLPFADYCAHPGINQSALQILLDGSPADLQAHLTTERRKPSAALRLGTNAHYLILQPDRFHEEVVLRPEKFASYTTKMARAWRDTTLAAGKLISTPDEYTKLVAMRDAIQAHPIARRLLSRGRAEVSLFPIDPETGLQLKCRLDFLPDPSLIADGPIPIFDLKTARNVNLPAWRQALRTERHYFQAAAYIYGCELCRLPYTCFIHCAVKSSPPFTVETYQVGARYLQRGLEEFKACLQTYKECSESGIWPGSSNQITTVDME